MLNYESYGTIELTQEGENLAKKILEAYDIVYLFLKDYPSKAFDIISISLFVNYG